MRKMAHTGDMPIRKLSPIEQLIILRHRKQWTQTVAARKLGVTVRALRSWEDGTRHPKPIVLRAIQAFVDAKADE